VAYVKDGLEGILDEEAVERQVILDGGGSM
jgi:hypothetical protein